MATDLVKSLTAIELSSLEKYESVINRGLKTFADVGNALLAIRDGRLYREQYATFEEYCREKWGLRQSRAYQLMDSAKLTNQLKSSTMVELPTNERQARPLAKLPPEEQPGAWQAATEKAKDAGRKVTAVDVATEVKIRKGELPKDPLDNRIEGNVGKYFKESDSRTLFHLKRYWAQASKKDKKIFKEWINENND